MHSYTAISSCLTRWNWIVKGFSKKTKQGRDNLFMFLDGQKVVCYYASWAIYRKGAGSMNVSHIDPMLCTHVVYSFAGLDIIENRIVSLDPPNDIQDNGPRSYKKFIELKEKNPCLKTVLAVGGWNEKSRKYSVVSWSIWWRGCQAKIATKLGFFLYPVSLIGSPISFPKLYVTFTSATPANKSKSKEFAKSAFRRSFLVCS